MPTIRKRIEVNEIIGRLLDLPGEMAMAESTLLRYDEERRQAANVLTDATDRLLLSGAIDGKNEATRASQLRQHLYSQQADLGAAESCVAGAKIHLHRLQNEHSSLRAIARIFGAMGD